MRQSLQALGGSVGNILRTGSNELVPMPVYWLRPFSLMLNVNSSE